MAKTKATEIDLNVLRSDIEKLGAGKKVLALSLLEKAQFLDESMKDLKKTIQKEGRITKMCQGSYSIDRESPAMRSYNATVKNFQSLIKQINEMLPDNDGPKEGEALMSFITKGS